MAGTVASAQGAGAIIGGVIVSILAHRHPRSLLIGRLIVMLAFSLALYAVAPNAAWVVAASALLGGSGAGFFIASSVIIRQMPQRQAEVAPASIMQFAMGVPYGIGLLFIGSIGDATNLHLAFGVGSILLLIGFGLMTLRSRHWRTAVDGGRRPAVAIFRIKPSFSYCVDSAASNRQSSGKERCHEAGYTERRQTPWPADAASVTIKSEHLL